MVERVITLGKGASSRPVPSSRGPISLSERFSMVRDGNIQRRRDDGKYARGSKLNLRRGGDVSMFGGESGGGTSSRRGRGGRFRRGRGRGRRNMNSNDLDKQLDDYMMKDEDSVKQKLDDDLNSYFAQSTTEEAAGAAATTTTTEVLPSTEALEEDVAMAE